MWSILLLAGILFIAWRVSPREKAEDAHVHGAGQVGLLAAVALFGVDYFTSYFYATGEMMSALHPYGLENYGYVAVAVIGLANFVFGALYIYSLGIFNEGGGSYTASMRYLFPTLSLIVAVTLIQDYVLTVVVSTLSGADQLLSILGSYGAAWYWHWGIGAGLATVTWFLTIRGRGESARVVFILLGVFIMLTVLMAGGLLVAHLQGVPAAPPAEAPREVTSLGEALFHMLTASMKGMVALTGLEAMSNGIQFVIVDDPGFVKWGRKRLPRLKRVWDFYAGRVGIGRTVQTSFLFYGGVTTLLLTFFAIRFDVYDGTLGRTLVGNLALIGFRQLMGDESLFWVYQVLAVVLLSAASITALQDIQSAEWRNVAMGEIPERVVYRDPRGTFTRSVTATWILAMLIQLAVRGQTTTAVPFYGVGVFMPITVMGLAIREHVKRAYQGRKRTLAVAGATTATVLAAAVFVGQIVGKWEEGGWMALVSFSVLAVIAHLMLLSPLGYREPEQIHRIVRDKARVQGAMASIVEWQSLRMQEYRYDLWEQLAAPVAALFTLFGVHRPMSLPPEPAPAGTYDDSLHVDHPDAPSLLERYIEKPAEGPADSEKH
jgi:hypothetical protein